MSRDQADYELPVGQALRRLLSIMLTKTKTPEELRILFEAVVLSQNRLLREMEKKQPPSRALACEAGCAYCCYWKKVRLSALETLALAQHIRDKFSDRGLTELTWRLSENIATRKQADGQGKRTLIECPLLVDGRCSAYDKRPFVCRGYTSFDSEVCRTGSEPTEGYIHAHKIALLTIRSIRAATTDRKLENRTLDLVPALHIALTQENTLERWLSGEEVFTRAESHPGR